MQPNYDLIIVGAGPAGIGAGIAAISSGLNTLMVHADSELGGQATNVYVGTICGVYERFSADANIVGNFPRGFTRKLADLSQTKPVTNSHGLSYLPYKREAFLKLATDLLNSKRLQIKGNTKVNRVTTESDTLKSIEIIHQDETIEVHAPTFIDCSGNGILSILGGADLIEEEQYQHTSLVVGLTGISEKDEQVLKLTLYKDLEEAFRAGIIKVKGKSLSFTPGTITTYPDIIHFKFSTYQEDSTYQEEVELLESCITYLKTRMIFSNVQIKFLSKAKGIRSSVRPRGLSVLTDKMVQNSIKSDHSIARGIWPVELWKGEKPPLIEHLEGDSYYDIPYTCLQSKSFTNLLSAGRALSAEEKAHSSARVIGTALQTGHAAGFVARSILTGENLRDATKEYQRLEGLC